MIYRDRDYAQAHPIPCVFCGGFHPRPGWPGEFNQPAGYWGGGWCPECGDPLPATCGRCLQMPLPKHVCGEPLRLVEGHYNGDAALQLARRYREEVLQYGRYELRHILGARDWPAWANLDDLGGSPLQLPPGESLWPSVEAAAAAIAPHLERLRLAEPPRQLALFG